MVVAACGKFLKSLKHALRGLEYMIIRERNFRIEMAVGVMIFILAFWLGMDKWELVSISFVVFGILILEAINTLVERLINIFNPRVHPYAKMLKDVTASIVLLGSIGAMVIGSLIFWPYVF